MYAIQYTGFYAHLDIKCRPSHQCNTQLHVVVMAACDCHGDCQSEKRPDACSAVAVWHEWPAAVSRLCVRCTADRGFQFPGLPVLWRTHVCCPCWVLDCPLSKCRTRCPAQSCRRLCLCVSVLAVYMGASAACLGTMHTGDQRCVHGDQRCMHGDKRCMRGGKCCEGEQCAWCHSVRGVSSPGDLTFVPPLVSRRVHCAVWRF